MNKRSMKSTFTALAVLTVTTSARAQIKPPPTPPGLNISRLTWRASGFDLTPGVPAPLPPVSFPSGQAYGNVYAGNASERRPLAGVIVTSSYSSYYTASAPLTPGGVPGGHWSLPLNKLTRIEEIGLFETSWTLNGQFVDLTFTDSAGHQVTTHSRLDLEPLALAPLGTFEEFAASGNINQNVSAATDGTLAVEVPEVRISPTAGGFKVVRGGDLAAPLTVGLRFGGMAVPGKDYAMLVGVVQFASGQRKVNVPISALPNAVAGRDVTATLLPVVAYDPDPTKNTAQEVYQLQVGEDRAVFVLP